MDRMNALNLAHHGGQMPPPPPAPTMANPMRIFSNGPISVAPPPAPTGPIMVSFPTGMPPPPPQNAQVFSPNQQFIYTKQAQTVPGFPPFAMVNNSMYANSIHPESENPSSTVSNTPDSEPMVKIYAHLFLFSFYVSKNCVYKFFVVKICIPNFCSVITGFPDFLVSQKSTDFGVPNRVGKSKHHV
jgi:hypothetical protein